MVFNRHVKVNELYSHDHFMSYFNVQVYQRNDPVEALLRNVIHISSIESLQKTPSIYEF
jgi:hypothetical protein